MPSDASVATFLRRAWPQPPHTRNRQALVTTPTPRATALVTFSCPQQFVQDVTSGIETFNESTNTNEPTEDVRKDHTNNAADVERLVSELYELRETVGDFPHCLSSTESHYMSLLVDQIVSSVAKAVVTASTESHGSVSVKEACRALLTLCVKPTSLARETAFSVMHSVIVYLGVLSTRTNVHLTTEAHTSQVVNELFLCVSDMVTKSVAVASSSTSVTDSYTAFDDAWIVNAIACLVLLVRRVGTDEYRTDRLARLDASTLVILVRRAFALPDAGMEFQDALVELLVSSTYAHRGRPGIVEGLSLADVERYGGIDLLLAIYYTTLQNRTRRQLLVVMFDVSIDQLKKSKTREEDKDSWPAPDSLLRCLHQCDFATLAATTPLSFTTHASTTARQVKTLSAAVANQLQEKNVALVWSAVRSTLQLDEYFVQSASLTHAVKLMSNQSLPGTGDSLAEMIAGKAMQLIGSQRVEERFRGERWLAELLGFGLHKSVNDSDTGGAAELRLLAEGNAVESSNHGNDQLEESLCYDEAAEIRLFARAKLWQLGRSTSVASRMTFARVLSLFTRRRVSLEAHPAAKRSHIRDLNQCLDALVAQHEELPAVLMTAMDTLLQIVIPSCEVPYLDLQRQRYDTDSSDVPQQVVGALVGSESLATEILLGVVSVDRSVVSEISVAFLLHTLAVLDTTDARIPSLMADYGLVAALLASYSLEDSPTQHTPVESLMPFLDARDARIAVIAAKSIVTQIKRTYGDQRYWEIVRQLHTAAVDSDDEALLSNSVAHARAVLQTMNQKDITP